MIIRQNLTAVLVDQLFPFPTVLKPKRGTKEFRHIRTLTVMLVTTTATALFWTLVLLGMYLVSGKAFALTAIVSLAVFLIIGLQTLFFYFFANVRFSATFLSTSFFLIVLLLVFFSGGYDSPSKILLISSTIISFRVSGREQGIMNALFVAMIVLAFTFIKHEGCILVNFFADAGEFLTASISWIATLTIVTTCLSAYDVDE